MYKCKICNREIKNNNTAISIHVKQHDLRLLEYLIKYEGFIIPKCQFCNNNAGYINGIRFKKTCCEKECVNKAKKPSEKGIVNIIISRRKWIRENKDKNPWIKTNQEREHVKKLKKFFEQNLSNYLIVQEYTPEDFDRSYSMDFAFINEKINIEVNGSQHYKNRKFGEFTEEHLERENYIKAKGWEVVNIDAGNINFSFDSIVQYFTQRFIIKSSDYKKIKTYRQIREEKTENKSKEIIDLYYKYFSLDYISKKLDIHKNDLNYLIKIKNLKRDHRKIFKIQKSIERTKYIEERTKLIRRLNFSKKGLIKVLSIKWKVSHTEVRRILKRSLILELLKILNKGL